MSKKNSAWNRWIAVLVATLFLSVTLVAQEKPGAEKARPVKTPHELRREWIASQAPKLIADKAKLQKFIAGLDGLNEFEINEMTNQVLVELEQRRKQQFSALRAANARERAAEAERQQLAAEQLQQQAIPNFFPTPPVIGFVREPYGYYPYPPPYYSYPPPYFPVPAVGYFPVVTWLPSGVSLSASALVSPDRRHVRMSLAPFFSTIGPVYTFNYMTGETRRLPEFDSPSENSQRERPAPPVYDGLRTRSGNEFRRNTRP
jgi:hypothetical protein